MLCKFAPLEFEKSCSLSSNSSLLCVNFLRWSLQRFMKNGLLIPTMYKSTPLEFATVME